MFSKRTIRPNAPVTHADDPQAALAASLSERGRVDLPYMARLTGMGENELAEALKGAIFRVPTATESSRLAARRRIPLRQRAGRSCASPS